MYIYHRPNFISDNFIVCFTILDAKMVHEDNTNCKRLFHRDNSIANLVKASYMPLNVGLQLHACIKQTFVSFLQLMFLWPSSAPGTCTWCWGRPAGGDLSLCTLCPPCAGTHWWCPDETSHQLQQTESTFNNSIRNFETFTTKKR